MEITREDDRRAYHGLMVGPGCWRGSCGWRGSPTGRPQALDSELEDCHPVKWKLQTLLRTLEASHLQEASPLRQELERASASGPPGGRQAVQGSRVQPLTQAAWVQIPA